MSAGRESLFKRAPPSSHLMGVERIASVPIEPVTVATLRAARRVRVDDLRDSGVAAEEFGHLGSEIDHEIPALGRGAAVETDDHGLGGRRVGILAHDLVRNEAALGQRPQKLIQLFRLDVGAAVDEHVLARAVRLLGDPAGDLQARVLGVAVDDVEIDLCHCAAEASRKSTSSGTGRPVAPLFAFARQATPAMSRCAHGTPSTKRSRKFAATLAPPSRVPAFAKSAKLLRSVSPYSSLIGMRQTGSSDRSPAVRNAVA